MLAIPIRRLILVFTILGPALAIFTLARVDAQPGGFRMEKIWKCSKCGGNLGNGVTPPPTCPRCGAKLRTPAVKNWPDNPAPRNPRTESTRSEDSPWSLGKLIAILVAGGAVFVLGFMIMKDWGPEA